MPPAESAQDPQQEYDEHLDFNTPLALIKRADGKDGLRLRVDPTHESEMFRFDWQIIYNGEVLRLRNNWEANNGFLAVESEAAEIIGWIRASHIEYVQYRQINYKLFDPDDDRWWCSEWNFDSSKCWVRVQQTIVERRNWNDLVQHLTDIGVAGKKITDELLEHWSDKGYTYVALELGKATSTIAGWKSWGDVHITLGYLPKMSQAEIDKLYRILNRLLEEWMYLSAECRPTKLIAFRQFRIQSRDERGYDSWKRESIVFYRKEYVERLVSEGRLHPHAPTSENIKELSDRIWERDHDRLNGAERRAQALPTQHAGVLTVQTPGSGLGAGIERTKSAEILDLLVYLVLRIDAFMPAHDTLDGKCSRPFLTHTDRLHCSPPRNLWFVRVPEDAAFGSVPSFDGPTTVPPPA